MGHPTACAAGLAVVSLILDRGLLEQVGERGRYLENALKGKFGPHPHVGDIRGRGLFWALEIVSDRAKKTPFDPQLRLAAKIKQAAFKAGLICYPMGGTVDGNAGDHILLAPPFIISEAEIDELIDRLALAVDRVIGAYSKVRSD